MRITWGCLGAPAVHCAAWPQQPVHCILPLAQACYMAALAALHTIMRFQVLLKPHLPYLQTRTASCWV